ncbi:MAG: leucyl/phenylalanyl-tRNA--protein transferase [Alphaproteobacteria bacterium]|nr:leucyl/phenylalanyl-tRNA--protein transferase [Alphaproteobacteria bacterium]
MTQLTTKLLLQAYAIGVFPMAESRHDSTVYFVDPEQRGIFPLDAIHISRSLRRTIRRRPFEIRLNTDFAGVLDACAEVQPRRSDTWINPEIRRLYLELHCQGYAHSVECWSTGVLVGGLYGVALGAAFFGESMFSRATDASKVALIHLAARLSAGGFTLLDAQFVTPHLRSLGAVEIPRATYRQRLANAVALRAQLPLAADPEDLMVLRYLQSTTQTS